jgi:hypothetical protein
LAVDLLFFPLDTLKTRLQAKEGFVRAGGFRGIYKGLGSVVIGSAPGGSAGKKRLARWSDPSEQRPSSLLPTSSSRRLYLG